jgi:competence protein ComFC
MSPWSSWVRQWADLFAVGSTECSVCKKTGPLISGICHSCRACIPWITDIHCPTCGRPVDCPDCKRRSSHYELNRAAVSYSSDMKGWLSLYKYRGDERLANLFGDMLYEPYKRLVMELGQGKKPFDVITYVPVSRERMAERGFNQAEQMAVRLGRRCRVPVKPLLERVRHTEKQSFKTRAERLADLRGAFEINRELVNHVAGNREAARVLLIDDVYTTGSTLDECSRILSQYGVKIYGLTWAR